MKFIKLTTMAGMVGYYNVSEIVFFFDSDLHGCILRLKGDAGCESVRQSADEVADLIRKAKP